LASVIVDKSIDPDSLLVGDRNAIIIATRVSGYGNDYSTKVTCPACGETLKNIHFDLNSADIFGGGNSTLGVINNDDGTFIRCTCQKRALQPHLDLLTGYDEKTLYPAAELDKKQKVET
jgi:hypothetical protein